MLTDEQKNAIKAAAEKQAEDERACVALDERIRARAYEIVQEAVNAPPRPVPAFAEAMEQARKDIEGAELAEKAAGGKVIQMRGEPPAERREAEPAPQP